MPRLIQGYVAIENGDRLEGVSVSNGREIVQTDSRGRYQLPCCSETRFVFITVPAGYAAADRFYFDLNSTDNVAGVLHRFEETHPELGADWYLFHGNARRTGSALIGPHPPLSLAWRAGTGGSIHIAAPLVVEGLVFQSTKNEDTLSGNGLAACDARDGALQWRHTTNSAIKRAPRLLRWSSISSDHNRLGAGAYRSKRRTAMELRVERRVSALGVYRAASSTRSSVHRCEFTRRGIRSGNRRCRLASR